MITNLVFDNFKCLDGKSFDLKNLNVFAGYNGRGKSSVLQSLLMLSQSTGHQLKRLHLNGDMIYLGEFDEILSDVKKNYVGFKLSTDDPKTESLMFGYSASPVDPAVGVISKCIINDRDFFDTASSLPTEGEQSPDSIPSRRFLGIMPETALNLFSNIHYISADRRGPVKFEERKDVPDVHRIHPYGDNAINTIASYRDLISPSMNLDKSDSISKSLTNLASEWLGYIMDGATVKVESAPHSPVMTMHFNIGHDHDSRDFSSFNVGFGYSYILSIIIAALIAKEGSIVIIENPEAHLHGQAQSRLTQLLSKLAMRGVQVFVETHSEHIINGFRLEMLRDNCSLSNEDAAFFFFDLDFSVKPLKVEKNGKILNWPDGFFNQETHDLAELMRLGAKVR